MPLLLFLQTLPYLPNITLYVLTDPAYIHASVTSKPTAWLDGRLVQGRHMQRRRRRRRRLPACHCHSRITCRQVRRHSDLARKLSAP